MIECSTLQLSLEYQDEEDKKAYSLIGIKDYSTESSTSPNRRDRDRMPNLSFMFATNNSSQNKKDVSVLNVSSNSSPIAAQKEVNDDLHYSIDSIPKQGYHQPLCVDNRCLSCSGQPGSVMSAFKIACL